MVNLFSRDVFRYSDKILPDVIVVAGTVIFLSIFSRYFNPILEYSHRAIAGGQIWRLVTCHFVHLNMWHMLLDLSGFLLCCYFFSDLLTRGMLWTWLVVESVAVGLMFWFLDPHLQYYVGLSGILHGLLVICLIYGWRGNPVLHSVVLVLVAGKIVHEQMPGYDVNYLRDWIHGSVYVNAHLYGAIVGAVLGPLMLWWHRRHPPVRSDRGGR